MWRWRQRASTGSLSGTSLRAVPTDPSQRGPYQRCTRAQKRHERCGLDRRSASAWPDPGELYATAANPRPARSDADQDATHARDRAAHPAQSALVVARISAGCCVSVLPATAAPIHAAVTGASSFCNGVLRTSGRPVAESSAAFGRCPRTHKPINRSLASAGAGVGWLGPADWLSIADDTRSPVGFPYHKPWQIEPSR